MNFDKISWYLINHNDNHLLTSVEDHVVYFESRKIISYLDFNDKFRGIWFCRINSIHWFYFNMWQTLVPKCRPLELITLFTFFCSRSKIVFQDARVACFWRPRHYGVTDRKKNNNRQTRERTDRRMWYSCQPTHDGGTKQTSLYCDISRIVIFLLLRRHNEWVW